MSLSGTATPAPAAVGDLLALALSRPDDAQRAARSLLSSRPPPGQASVAHQALGIVSRDRGDVTGAIGHLRTALTLALSSGDPDRIADVRATLGIAMVLAGRTTRGLAELDRAAAAARGGLLGRILYRRAVTFWELGRLEPASQDLSAALPLLRRAGDDIWQARALNLRHLLLLLSGATGRAAADLDLAEQLFESAGQEYECAMTRFNRGSIAVAQGNLPQALARFDEAARRYAALGTIPAELALDRSSVLLAAGLATDAWQVADDAAAAMPIAQGRAVKRAELLHAAANAALAIPDLPAAVDRAQQAGRMFRAQGRSLWQARSGLVRATARYRAGTRSARLLTQIEALSGQFDRQDVELAQRAHLLAGRLALDLGRTQDAEAHLTRAARVRPASPPQVRSRGWLAKALWAQSRDDTTAALTASRRGLDALQEHQLTLGSTELRAHATAHGAELAAIAQRQALRSSGGEPRRAARLLIATERWRATVQSLPAHRPGTASPAEPLAALRAVVKRLESDRAQTPVMRGTGGPSAWLERERRRLEGDIRARAMHQAGAGAPGRRRLDVTMLAQALGDTRLIELVEVDGVLQVLTVAGGRIRRYPLGSVPVTLVEQARFTLRRAARAQGRVPGGLRGLLDEIGRRLQDSLLGPAVQDLGQAEPLVVVPPGNLQAVPWSLLPALHDRVLSVAPSAAAFIRAREVSPAASGQVVFVTGPGLTTGSGEVTAIAQEYPKALVLEGKDATAEATLAALDGAQLAHVAAHGSFRLDNPLFSALQLDDGPLTVHDFERLSRAPYRLILPCCDSGVGAPVGSDELLGLVSSLMPLGSAGILASVTPINDAATVPLMIAVHAALRAGEDLPHALLSARRLTGDDMMATATGYSFIAFGI